MMTVDDIFHLLGGPAEVGRIIGKSTEHAASMRRRGSVPVRYWAAILDASTQRNVREITHAALVAAHTAGAPQLLGGAAPPENANHPEVLG
jgi:hypothetical protein